MTSFGKSPEEKAIESWLVGRLAAAMATEPGAIELGTEFADLGVTSLTAANLFTAIEADLRVTVEPSIFWTHPTIETMAKLLASLGARAA